MTEKQFKKEVATTIIKVLVADITTEQALNDLWLLHKKEIDLWKEKSSSKI